MYEPHTPSDSPDAEGTPESRPAPPFSHPLTHLAAWIVIGLVVSLLMLASMLPVETQEEQSPGIALTEEMNGRLFLGINRLDPSASGMFLPELAPWATGTAEQRLAYAVVVSDLDSPEAGLEQLEAIHEAIDDGTLQVSEGYGELLELVGLLLFASAAGEEADELPSEQRALLEEKLGVFGEVLHASATNDADRIEELDRQLVQGALAFAVMAIWFIGMGFCGLVVLGVLGIMCIMGKLRLGFLPGTLTGSVYLETFAIWLFIFFGSTFVVQVLLAIFLDAASTDMMLIGTLLAFALSFSALLWPMVRGIRFSQMCQEIGLTAGRPFIEVLAGVATYAAAIPLLVLGGLCFLLLSWVLTALFGELPAPSHPIQDAMDSSALGVILIYLMACVAAPIMEETMFRGVLFRYLRNSTSRWGWFASFAGSALLSSFIFAAIHPQGIAFIPILGALAVAFCIGREWRGSLIAPIVAHGLSNSVIVTLNIFL